MVFDGTGDLPDARKGQLPAVSEPFGGIALGDDPGEAGVFDDGENHLVGGDPNRVAHHREYLMGTDRRGPRLHADRDRETRCKSIVLENVDRALRDVEDDALFDSAREDEDRRQPELLPHA